MNPFSARRDGSIDVHLTEVEAGALAHVAGELLEALRVPEDEALARLFPPAYEDDPLREEEFAVMTRLDLTARKRANAQAVIDTITGASRKRDRVAARLDPDRAQAWLGLLNDARLVLGDRIGVTEDMDGDPLPEDDPRAPAHNLYVYLSGLEWALVEALMR